MSVYRIHKEKDYSVIDNYLFRDKNLSLRGKGLLALILSLPDDWKYSIEGLSSLVPDGKNTVIKSLDELMDLGYIIRKQDTDESGKFTGYVYDIFEKPCAYQPFSENENTENNALSNTNLLNTNIENTKNDITPIIPAEIAKRKEMFEQFWAAYPKCKRKVDKKGCERKFLKIKDLEKIFPDIMASLEMWKKSKQWTKDNGEYIPLTSKWINQEYWTVTDERTERQIVADQLLAQNMYKFFGGQ